jgi:hypothetical protein
MPTKRIDHFFRDLPLDKQLVSVGAILLIISVFLPWYSDIDSFKAGYTFLGITGPLYLFGVSMVTMSVFCFLFLFFDVFNKKPSHIKIKNSTFYLFSGFTSLYLLILVNSIYFHSQFGFNITLKEPQFGMYAAFLGTGLILAGGFLAAKDKAVVYKELEEAAREPALLSSSELIKPKANLRSYSPQNLAQNRSVPADNIKQSQPFRTDL